jgi:hypothetical protein
MPANAVSGGVADFVDIAGQDLSGKKVQRETDRQTERATVRVFV